MHGLTTRPSVAMHGLSVFGWRSYAAGKDSRPVEQNNSSLSRLGVFSVFLWSFAGICAILIFSTISESIAQVQRGNKNYQSGFLKRWCVLVLVLWCYLVASFFSPGGPPTHFPLVSVNIVFLGILFESIIGSIPTTSSVDVWLSKYHVMLAFLFAVPQVLVSLYELVAIVVSSYGTYGQIHVGSIGAIGGDTNQIRGSSNSYVEYNAVCFDGSPPPHMSDCNLFFVLPIFPPFHYTNSFHLTRFLQGWLVVW